MENNLYSKQVAHVYESNDYKAFKKMKYNRDVNMAEVANLVGSFRENDLLNPILVNGNFEIIDGQHRFEARQYLGLPIMYVIDEKADIEDCRRLNRFNSKWGTLDYIQSYADGGNINYQNLLEAMRRTGWSITRLNNIVSGFNTGGHSLPTIKSGRLLFPKEKIEEAVKKKDYTEDIMSALHLTYDGLPVSFLRAVRDITSVDGYDHDRMLSGCRKRYDSFRLFKDKGLMLHEFSKTYNYQKSKNKLRFEELIEN